MGVSPTLNVPQSQSPQQSVNELTAEQMAEDVLLHTLMQVENQVEKLRQYFFSKSFLNNWF